MKNKDLIKKLQEFDGELDVFITDGYEGIVYSTNNVDMKLFEEKGEITLDIGIGGNKI